MTFSQNLKNNLNKNRNDINENDPNFAKSFNNLDYKNNYKKVNGAVANEETELVIVGTLTPKDGRDNGYYYTSKGNEQYLILDKWFNLGTSLASLKSGLKQSKNKGVIINEIKDVLIQNHIAFIDVIDCAISPNPDDNKIDPFCLDRNSFYEFININKNAVYICNSHNSEEAFKIISKDNDVNYMYAPQTKRAKDRDQRWKDALDKLIDKSSSLYNKRK